MKLDEFIKKLKQCGFEVNQPNNKYIEITKHSWSRQVSTHALPTSVGQWTVAEEKNFYDLFFKYAQTPIKERFPEKKFRLRWIDSNLSDVNPFPCFLCFMPLGSGYWDIADNDSCGKTIFTESELDKLKRDNPRLAPAIDAMKEEVKDND